MCYWGQSQLTVIALIKVGIFIFIHSADDLVCIQLISKYTHWLSIAFSIYVFCHFS